MWICRGSTRVVQYLRAGLALTALALIAPTPAGAANMRYYGGPVMQSVNLILVDWTASTNAVWNANDPAFLTDVTQMPVFSALRQYRDSSGAAFADGSTYGGSYTITPSNCATGSTCTVTDAQIQTELSTQMTAGHIPAPTGDGLSTAYVVEFPSNVTITHNGGTSGSQFCAYYSSFVRGSARVFYTAQPDLGSTFTGCGASASLYAIHTRTLSLELVAMITDPLIAEASAVGPPLSWYSSGGEPANSCTTSGQPEGQNTVGTHTWTVATVRSVLDSNGCITSHTWAGTPTAAFGSTPAPAGSPTAFDATASTSPNSSAHAELPGSTSDPFASGVVSYSWNFGDGSSAGSGVSPTHAYAAAGTYDTALTVTDAVGFKSTVHHDVLVSPAPQPPGGDPPGETPPPGGPSDTTPPATSKDDGPAKKTTKRKATFSFSSEDGASFECALDEADFAACTSPAKVKHLKPGKHSFAVRAIDAAGNPDPTPEVWKFKVLEK
jgi:PKD repeat protein